MSNSHSYLNPLIPTHPHRMRRRIRRIRSARLALAMGLFCLAAGLSQGFSKNVGPTYDNTGPQHSTCQSLHDKKFQECIERVSFYPQNDACFQEVQSQYQACNRELKI